MLKWILGNIAHNALYSLRGQLGTRSRYPKTQLRRSLEIRWDKHSILKAFKSWLFTALEERPPFSTSRNAVCSRSSSEFEESSLFFETLLLKLSGKEAKRVSYTVRRLFFLAKSSATTKQSCGKEFLIVFIWKVTVSLFAQSNEHHQKKELLRSFHTNGSRP